MICIPSGLSHPSSYVGRLEGLAVTAFHCKGALSLYTVPVIGDSEYLLVQPVHSVSMGSPRLDHFLRWEIQSGDFLIL